MLHLVLITYKAQPTRGICQVWKQGSDATCILLYNTHRTSPRQARTDTCENTEALPPAQAPPLYHHHKVPIFTSKVHYNQNSPVQVSWHNYFLTPIDHETNSRYK